MSKYCNRRDRLHEENSIHIFTLQLLINTIQPEPVMASQIANKKFYLKKLFCQKNENYFFQNSTLISKNYIEFLYLK